MPSLDVIRAATAKLHDGPPLVAVFTATTGIGPYTAKELAKAFASSGSKLRVYIVGRNAERAEALCADGRQLSPGSDWQYVPAKNLALINEVDDICAEIRRREERAPFQGGPARVDLLYMSHCWPVLKKREDTSEGLDTFLSTTYYSRIRFITQLEPLLIASPSAHVISIYAGNFEDPIKPGQQPIGLPPPEEYGVGGVRKYTSFMKVFMFETLAEKHAGHISFTYVYPGLVDGPAFYVESNTPLWFRWLWPVIKVVFGWYMTSAEDCGQVMLFLATPTFPAKGTSSEIGDQQVARSTKGQLGGGSYATGHRAEWKEKGMSFEKHRQPDTAKKVWDHTMEVIDRVVAGRDTGAQG